MSHASIAIIEWHLAFEKGFRRKSCLDTPIRMKLRNFTKQTDVSGQTPQTSKACLLQNRVAEAAAEAASRHGGAG